MIRKLMKTCLPILMMYISREQYEPLLVSTSNNNLNEYSTDFLRPKKQLRFIIFS